MEKRNQRRISLQ